MELVAELTGGLKLEEKMAIPTILKGDTAKPIRLALAEGYDYSGCSLLVAFCGAERTFGDLAAGGSVPLAFTADETAAFPLGTSRVMMSLRNAAGEVRTLPWAKIKVTDCPADVHDAQITIDPATLDVDDLTAGDSLGAVKSRLNAVMAFLRALKALAVCALPFFACADVTPLYTTPNDMPGDAPLMTNTQAYVEAKMAEAGKVRSVNGQTGDVEIAASDVGAMPADAKVSRLYNGGGSRYISGDGSVYLQNGEDRWRVEFDGATYDFVPNFGIASNYWECTSFKGRTAFLAYAWDGVEWWTLNIGIGSGFNAEGVASDSSLDFQSGHFHFVCTRYSTGTAFAYETRIAYEDDVQEVSEANAQTRAIVTTWENFLDGSNVVFSITNYLSGAYSLDTAKLKILELRDGAYQEVYNSRDEILLHIDNFKTNDFRVATNQVIGAVSAAIGNKADKDWGKYTSAGGDAPENAVYLTAPNTVFAGGLEYERVAVGEGTVCVLTAHGAPVWTQGDEGTFKFQDDGGTNFFGFAKTDSYTIGANTDGITVQSGIVTLTYSITMSGRPCVWYKSSLTGNAPWEQLNLPDGSPVSGASHAVTWEQNPPAGTQTCYVNVGNAPSGFFRATVEAAGEAKFMTNMKADLSGGIMCTNTATGVMGVIRPSYDGSTVNWTWSAN